MRSRFVVCAALAGFFAGWSPAARAADPKSRSGNAKSGNSKSGKKKATAGLSDDKVIDKQLQWEDSVMGPDDKRAELDKIARAQAINKAAAEKAERDKERAAAAAAREPAPKAQTSKRGGEVALPVDDDDSGNANRGSRGGRESSGGASDNETAAVAPPPPPVRHGDDKFIDKLLKDEPSKRKKASASDDKALADLLATDKPAKPVAKARGKRADDVDSLLDSADKAPPMPEVKVRHETPEWAKPEIRSTPEAAPIVSRPVPKRDDGIIHVVQGAASEGRSSPAATRTLTNRTAAATEAPPARRQQASSRSAGWNDPFAEAPKKTVAASDTRGSDDDDEAPVRRHTTATPTPAAKPSRGARNSDAGWNDPFTDAPKAATTRRTAPAAKPAKNEETPARRGAWKDPFTEAAAAPSPALAA
jgi:hypothetical protein